MTNGKIDFRLDPLYVNGRRVLAFAGVENFQYSASRWRQVSVRAAEHAEAVELTELFGQWLAQNAAVIKPFEVLWATGALSPGSFFSVRRHFWFRSVATRSAKAPPVGYTKYEQLGRKEGTLRLQLRLHHNHVLRGSPADLLSGKVGNLFVFAVVEAVDDCMVEAVPVLIGRMIEYGPLSIPLLPNRREVFIDAIDSFARVRRIRRPREEDLEVLKRLPESEVKRAVAEIVGEDNIPADWGGESSDLVTSNLLLEGQRIHAAFLFKGSAGGKNFRPMKLAHLGRQGDQIVRLSTEPADLLIVQHCHKITQPVRSMLRAFSSQVGSERRYCLIDGYDTWRLLYAYSKCGL